MLMLNERNKKVLCAIVQSYINFPDPVGSRVCNEKIFFWPLPSYYKEHNGGPGRYGISNTAPYISRQGTNGFRL